MTFERMISLSTSHEPVYCKTQRSLMHPFLPVMGQPLEDFVWKNKRTNLVITCNLALDMVLILNKKHSVAPSKIAFALYTYPKHHIHFLETTKASLVRKLTCAGKRGCLRIWIQPCLIGKRSATIQRSFGSFILHAYLYISTVQLA